MTFTSKYIFALSLLSLAACSPDVRFAEGPLNEKVSVDLPSEEIPDYPDVIPTPTPVPTPVPTPEPTPVPTPEPTPTPPPPVPEPVYSKASGPCAADSSTSVTSGMKCLVPVIPPEQPPMSQKAKNLMAAMTNACKVNNASYGANYKAPSAESHLAKLNRCSATLYKDTGMTSAQSSTISKLAAGDTALVNKMFSGLWYNAPYSDHFETYFGIMVHDVVKVFCQNNVAAFPTIVYPLGYFEGITNSPNYQMPVDYVLANQYRVSLQSCMNESLNNPWKPGPVPAGKTCDYETLSGEAGSVIKDQVAQWLAKGQMVGADVKNVGHAVNITHVDQLNGYTGEIKVGTYVCK